ncbi:uncharacterized protein Dere_GG19457 [Drosophila erecta]|nr:uncharacterized protein Dere_GG19457 [Drosophila erecta]
MAADICQMLLLRCTFSCPWAAVGHLRSLFRPRFVCRARLRTHNGAPGAKQEPLTSSSMWRRRSRESSLCGNGMQTLVALALLLLAHIAHPMESLDDFEVPVEVTTLHAKKDMAGPVNLQRIEGRTRLKSLLTFEGDNRTGKMIENYCCFWIYQAHPPIPHTWKHMAEYPFDFQFNGEFVRNQRHNAVEVPAAEDGDKGI